MGFVSCEPHLPFTWCICIYILIYHDHIIKNHNGAAHENHLIIRFQTGLLTDWLTLRSWFITASASFPNSTLKISKPKPSHATWPFQKLRLTRNTDLLQHWFRSKMQEVILRNLQNSTKASNTNTVSLHSETVPPRFRSEVGTYVGDLAPSQAHWRWVQHRYLASDGNGEKRCPSESFLSSIQEPLEDLKKCLNTFNEGKGKQHNVYRYKSTCSRYTYILYAYIYIGNHYLVVRFHVKLVGHNSNQKSIIHQVFHPQIESSSLAEMINYSLGSSHLTWLINMFQQVQQQKSYERWLNS